MVKRRGFADHMRDDAGGNDPQRPVELPNFSGEGRPTPEPLMAQPTYAAVQRDANRDIQKDISPALEAGERFVLNDAETPYVKQGPIFRKPELKGWLKSTQNRVLLLLILVLSLILLVTAYGVYTLYEKALQEHYEQYGEALAAAVSASSSQNIGSEMDGAELKLRQFADRLIENSMDVGAIEFYNNKGELLYERSRAMSPDQKERMIDFTAPIKGLRSEDKSVGEVHVKLTGQAIQNISNSTKTIVIVVFLGIWIISLLAVAINSYIHSKHLRTLVRGVRRISSGDFGYKISDQDLWGELRILAEAFNDMSRRLRAYETQNLDTITVERNKMEAVLLSIVDGVIVCDHSGEIVIANDSACGMLSVTHRHLLLGSRIQDYVTLENDRCFETVIEAYQALNQERVYSRRKGEDIRNSVYSDTVELPELTMRVTLSPLEDLQGNHLGFVMIMNDITKEAEVDKLKTSFISNVSHELRTPVTTIKSYVDTLYHHGDELDEATREEFIETIHLETDRLKKLVNDILDFSRLEETHFHMEKHFEEIGPIINLTVQSMKVLAEQKNLTVSTTIESNLPKVYINSESIERVLKNLLSNAFKYTNEGGRIRVRAEMVDSGSEKTPWLEVTVHDNGIGIPAEHIPYIFDRFYRVETKVHTVKGTGLGLHLVKIAIEEHHAGEVFVKSDVNQGSTFGIRLPIIDPATLAPV